MTPKIIKQNIVTIDGKNLPLSAGYYAPESKIEQAVLFFCLPGGGINRRYYDLGEADGQLYSFARRLSGMGHHVITMDNPGIGDNILPDDHPFLTPRVSASYIRQALAGFVMNLELERLPCVGTGHSMGGMMIVLVQGDAEKPPPFSHVIMMSSSAGGLDWGLSEEEKAYVDQPIEFERDLEKLTLAKFSAPFVPIPIAGGPDEESPIFGGETKAVNSLLAEAATPLFAAGGLMSMVRGSFRKQVEAINVPMFFAFGDNDIGIPLEEATKDFSSAPSHECLLLENTGHNSMAFSSHVRLCEAADRWVHQT